MYVCIYIYICIERERDLSIYLSIDVCICIYVYMYIYIYIYICICIYIYIYKERCFVSESPNFALVFWGCTANLRTNIIDFRGFDSNRVLVRDEIVMEFSCPSGVSQKF